MSLRKQMTQMVSRWMLQRHNTLNMKHQKFLAYPHQVTRTRSSCQSPGCKFFIIVLAAPGKYSLESSQGNSMSLIQTPVTKNMSSPV